MGIRWITARPGFIPVIHLFRTRKIHLMRQVPIFHRHPRAKTRGSTAAVEAVDARVKPGHNEFIG